MRIAAADEGKIVIGLWPYGPKGYQGNPTRLKTTKSFNLTPGKVRKCTYTFTLHPNTRRIVPFVGVAGNGKAEIVSYSVELLTDPVPAKKSGK